MPGAFLYDNRIPAASLTAALATVGTMPLSNLLDPQPRMRVRFPGTTATIIADLLAATAIDAVALLSTTATASATIRVRLSTSDPAVATGDAWDTGTVSAATSGQLQGQVVVISPSQVTGRYLRVDLVDGTLPQVDVGLLAAGPLWRLSRAMRYGFREGRLMLDQRGRNAFTAAEFPIRAVINPRYMAFAVELLSSTEARVQHRAMLNTLGAAGDALWIPETAVSQAEINARSLWGAVNPPGELVGIERSNFPGWGRGWTMVERV